ncbi:uncharacterized protein LOC116249905 [Nymphaea colorata]|nr:uncharacterized protein LOC116249905 [Nymphaea colorata]
MSQFPSFMRQLPAMPVVPSSLLLPSQWPHSQNDEFTLTVEEAELEDKLNEIRKANANLVVIGKVAQDNDKEDFDGEADDDDVDNVDESEGDEFEQETG